MSLKSFHIFFIVLSILLAAGFGYWAVGNLSGTSGLLLKVLGGIALASAAGLSGYLAWFIRKSRHLPS